PGRGRRARPASRRRLGGSLDRLDREVDLDDIARLRVDDGTDGHRLAELHEETGLALEGEERGAGALGGQGSVAEPEVHAVAPIAPELRVEMRAGADILERDSGSRELPLTLIAHLHAPLAA